MLSVVFIGTSSFALPTLLALHNDARFRILGVVTQPAKPVGRKHEIKPSPVEKKAKTLGLKVWSPEKIGDIIKELASLQPDAIVVASYGQIIPENILAIPRLGVWNIHPSLLPKYRGAAPVQAALLAGEKETGVTIMLMDKEIDHGPVVAQEKIKLDEQITAPDLLAELAGRGAQLLIENLIKFLENKIKPKEQNHKLASMSKIFNHEDGKIDFKKSATEIFNQYRALTPWPGIFAHTNNKTVKLLRLARSNNQSNNKAGTLFEENGKLFLQAKDGALEILELQMEGGKPLDAKTFLNGYGKKLPFLA